MWILRLSACSAMCAFLAILGGCKHDGGDGDHADAAVVADACEGLGCSIVDCTATNQPRTSVSGTVYAPNGSLPLYGVTVYVPVRDPGPLAAGVQCARCADDLQGGAY